jgi:hypothetical protein
MASDPEPDVHKLWQDQPGESHRMSLDEIRVKAERFDAKTRRQRTLGAALVIVLAIGTAVEVVWPGQSIVERTGDFLTLAAFVYIAYEYRKYARAALRPESLGLTNCVDFYRAELMFERNLARQSRRYLLPFVPGVALSLMGGVLQGPPARRFAVVIAGVALFLGVAWVNAHTARKLQKEIDALHGR